MYARHINRQNDVKVTKHDKHSEDLLVFSTGCDGHKQLVCACIAKCTETQTIYITKADLHREYIFIVLKGVYPRGSNVLF